MEPIEKLDIILRYQLRKKKYTLSIGEGKHSVLVIENLKGEIHSLEMVLIELDMIMQNAPSVSEPVIEKMRIQLESKAWLPSHNSPGLPS